MREFNFIRITRVILFIVCLIHFLEIKTIRPTENIYILSGLIILLAFLQEPRSIKEKKISVLELSIVVSIGLVTSFLFFYLGKIENGILFISLILGSIITYKKHASVEN